MLELIRYTTTVYEVFYEYESSHGTKILNESHLEDLDLFLFEASNFDGHIRQVAFKGR